MQSKHDLIVEPIGLDVDRLARPIVWSEIFQNSNPVEIEIGIGKGTFITDQAMIRPDTNFFGIEYARFFWRSASDRLRRNHCNNARTVRAEAKYFLNEFVPDESISALHIYFPDPWPKKRHQKRRLIQESFIPTILRILVPEGRIQMVTDHADYFEQMQSVVNRSPLSPASFQAPGGAAEGEVVGTNFERKYRREGRPFYALAAVKQASSPAAETPLRLAVGDRIHFSIVPALPANS